MSTQSKNGSTQNRKAKHLSICSDPLEYRVESGTTGFEGIHFVHQALPEMDAAEVDTKTVFAGYEVDYPFFISCMTGGSGEGFRANKNLARAAQAAGIPVGTGSIRILFEDESVFGHFHLKKYAPDVPVMANIGGVQLRDIHHARIIEMVKKLEVQALAVHLNPGQEVFQPDGDRNFKGIKNALLRYCELSPVPVIVKETGFGITPALIEELLLSGVSYVDIAGSGGTNWISVESYRNEESAIRNSAADFEGWGLPTAFILAGLGDVRGEVLASGGIRTGMDISKSIALGAELAGLALPFIRAEVEEGVDGVTRLIESLAATLRNVMLLTGSKSVKELKRVPLWFDGDFTRAVDSIRAAGRTAPYLV